jgi:hypothetical protein
MDNMFTRRMKLDETAPKKQVRDDEEEMIGAL